EVFYGHFVRHLISGDIPSYPEALYIEAKYITGSRNFKLVEISENEETHNNHYEKLKSSLKILMKDQQIKEKILHAFAHEIDEIHRKEKSINVIKSILEEAKGVSLTKLKNESMSNSMHNLI
ncbi:MAG: hypothetical protein QW056_04410, partial [Candidatus Bathyarchaeia archaeon]